MSVTAFTTHKPFDTQVLISCFNQGESQATGTMLIHHGKVKRPGKTVPDFDHVDLVESTPNTVHELRSIGLMAWRKFDLLQVLIVHRLGRVSAGDDILYVAVSARERGGAFAGCAAIVDAIKDSTAIRLVENKLE